MALRIGLLILASCNLFNADVITVARGALIAPRPLVSFPLVADHQDDRHDNDNEGPKLGADLRPLGYNSPKEQKPETKETKVVVVQGHNWVGHSHRNRVRRYGSSGRSDRDSSSSSQGHSNSHRTSSVNVRVQRPVAVVQTRPEVVVSGKPAVVTVQRPVAVVVEPVPRPSVIISNSVIGNNAVRQIPIRYDNDRINVNETPVNFGSLNYVEHGEQIAKAPITVVTVPQISTAKTTQHRVATNEVINQSNTPSIQNYRNRLADQLLFSYNELLKTKIREIADVPEPTKTPVPAPVRSELVRPGKLERVVKKQLIVGQRNENAPIVIQKFLTTINERAQDCNEDHDHSVHLVVRGNIHA